ncbi:amino acid ABC transporter ATP-binding/permease protein [Snodgrassella gandavensis]|uniref:amino acid ABC transporter ATP-binding/permease protein n=1 Tax=Snodgrassella gandavensis TaxID=2946698 RepID=UPI001EF736A5|nr:ATP-binding cassette domain-containing protein [Snodgrassella gandavensis]
MMKRYHLLWAGQQLKLSNLLLSRKGAWILAWLLGQATAIASIALLALSGWFITAAGLAGLLSLATAYTFNYFTPAGIIRLLAIVRTAGRYGERLGSHDAVLGLLADLRSGLFARLAAGKQQSASVRQMHRLLSDIELLNNWPLNVVLPWLWALIMLLCILGLTAIVANGLLALYLGAPLLVATVVIPAVAAWCGQNWGRQQAAQAEQRRAALLQPLEVLTALLQWQQWPRFATAFFAEDGIYVSGQLRQQQLAGKVVLLQQVCLAIAAAILLWQGSVQLGNGSLSIAMLLALLLAVFGFSELVLLLGMNMMTYGLCRAACARLNAIVPAQTLQEFTKPALPVPFHLQARGICARWPGALNGAENISFEVINGDILLLQGVSGAGKSTLLAVLADELQPESGELYCNQQPFAAWQWQGQVAYLAQQLDIFDLTLAENLRLGKAEATDDELWAVLASVGLAAWAENQPEKLDTPLGEYGAAVSGGQARRIALARLLLRPYALMILDEPFAGIDEQSQTALAAMLKRHQQQGILIVASHQVNPWPDAQVLRVG